MSTLSPVQDELTNTLVLTGLPRDLFQLEYLSSLQKIFASFGEINQWVPLRSMVRIIIVFRYDEDAMRAKTGCEDLFRDAHSNRSVSSCLSLPLSTQSRSQSLNELRIYSGDRNPLRSDSLESEVDYLKVPELEKNFLISPPGSPPIGWEPVKEDPPNAAPLADDIITALRQLELLQKPPGIEMLLHPDEGSGIAICVEDCGAETIASEDVDWDYGESSPLRNRWIIPPTSLPPLRPSFW
jgi:hypothetical protein